MITALIRTHPGREQLLQRAIASLGSTPYILHEGDKVTDYSYNLYCNTLKAQVQEGYFFFLDSDDIVIEGALQRVAQWLKPNHANIVQMLRNGQPKPRRFSNVKRGHVGGPCLLLHVEHKSISDWTSDEYGDWRYIQGVIRKLPINFIPFPVVDAGKRSFGK